MRTLIRFSAVATILAFTVYTIGALESQTAGAPLLAGISALLLLLLLRAATIAGRTYGNR